MNRLRTAINAHPLTAFVLITYVLSWWSAPFTHGSLIPYGPFLAALIVLGFTKGRTGIRDLFRRMASWRGGWYWVLVAPGLVLAYLLAALAINLTLGSTLSSTFRLGSLASSFLPLLLLGGLWEEPGWTGFALPLLLEQYANRRHGLLLASIHVGLIRTIWHLPLILYGDIPWYDGLVFTMAFQLLIAWLFSRTGGSVLLVMLFHLTSNIIGGGLSRGLFTGVDRDRYYLLFVAMAWLLAVLLTQMNRPSMGPRVQRAEAD